MARYLKDLRQAHSFDLKIVEQLDKEFGDDYAELQDEYNEFWDNGYLEQVEKQSSGGNGHIAGAGPIILIIMKVKSFIYSLELENLKT